MARFKLVPLEQKSAQEQLWAAARQATLHVLKTHRFYGLQGNYREPLIEDVTLAAVSHFMRVKIGQHRYNRNFCFFNNVMSSVWTVQHLVADRHVKDMIRRYHSSDIDDVSFNLTEKDRFPLYVSRWEKSSRNSVDSRPYGELERPSARAGRIREMYATYLEEARELGLENVLGLGPWIVRNGYGDDHEMLLHLEPANVRASMICEHSRIMRDLAIPPDELGRRLYMREYSRNRHREKLEAQAREFDALYGAPPEGYRWTKRGDLVCLQRVRGPRK